MVAEHIGIGNNKENEEYTNDTKTYSYLQKVINWDDLIKKQGGNRLKVWFKFKQLTRLNFLDSTIIVSNAFKGEIENYEDTKRNNKLINLNKLFAIILAVSIFGASASASRHNLLTGIGLIFAGLFFYISFGFSVLMVLVNLVKYIMGYKIYRHYSVTTIMHIPAFVIGLLLYENMSPLVFIPLILSIYVIVLFVIYISNPYYKFSKEKDLTIYQEMRSVKQSVDEAIIPEEAGEKVLVEVSELFDLGAEELELKKELVIGEKPLPKYGEVKISEIDQFSNYKFTSFFKEIFEEYGYKIKELNDNEAEHFDIRIVNDFQDILIQSKRFKGPVHNRAVEGAAIEKNNNKSSHVAILNNGDYTEQAKNTAKMHGIVLIDRKEMIKFLNEGEPYFSTLFH